MRAGKSDEIGKNDADVETAEVDLCKILSSNTLAGTKG